MSVCYCIIISNHNLLNMYNSAYIKVEKKVLGVPWSFKKFGNHQIHL